MPLALAHNQKAGNKQCIANINIWFLMTDNQMVGVCKKQSVCTIIILKISAINKISTINDSFIVTVNPIVMGLQATDLHNGTENACYNEIYITQ